jgi:hypothetical protein
MNDIWFEEELVPSPKSIDELLSEKKGPMGRIKREQLEAIRGAVRVHKPRWQELNPDEVVRLRVANPSDRIIIIRLGCEFDPGEDARKARIGFVSATARAILEGKEQLHPLVYDLAPVKVDQGKPRSLQFNLEPTLKFPSGAGGSLGGYFC